MKNTFSHIVEAAYSLSLEERLELFNLLKKNISDEKAKQDSFKQPESKAGGKKDKIN